MGLDEQVQGAEEEKLGDRHPQQFYMLGQRKIFRSAQVDGQQQQGLIAQDQRGVEEDAAEQKRTA